MMMPIMQFVGNLGYVMVALLGGVFVIKKSIEVGDIQSFFQYIRNFTQPISADRTGYKPVTVLSSSFRTSI